MGAEIAVEYTKKTAQYIPTTHSLEVRASQYFSKGRPILKFRLSIGKFLKDVDQVLLILKIFSILAVDIDKVVLKTIFPL